MNKVQKTYLTTQKCPSCMQYYKLDPKGFAKQWQAVFKDTTLLPVCMEGCKSSDGTSKCCNHYTHHQWYCYGIHINK